MSKVDWFAKNRTYMAMLLLLVCFFFCYFLTLKGLFNIWSTNDDYSYGFLIPLVSGYLVWERRGQMNHTTTQANWFGVIPFFLFLLISLYGVLGSSPSAVQPTIPLVLLSVVLLCFGCKMFKVLFFPLAFLIFMIPLPTLIQSQIGLPLKLLSTELGAVILRLVGVSVFVEGSVIDLGVTQLQVVDACAGLRFVLPLLALGAIFAHFFERFWRKKVLLVAAAVPIAVVTNSIRIAITGILSYLYGSEIAMGFFHSFSGWVVFIFAFTLLFMFHFFILKRVHFREHAAVEICVSGMDVTGSKAREMGLRSKNLSVVVCGVSFLLFGALGYSAGALPAVNVKGGMSSFPLAVGQWQGKEEAMDPEIISLSGAQQALNATYTMRDRGTVDLYIGYRSSPFVESENFFHSPDVCLPSAGWHTIELGTRTIRGVAFFDALTVAKMVIEKPGERQLVYYWFQTKSRVSHGVNVNRLHLALHAIKRDNTYDLFIRPITVISPNETLDHAQERMDSFVRDLMPVLLKFIRDNQCEGRP
jgi:exosortase D (VPLPA-CTERM-specific)